LLLIAGSKQTLKIKPHVLSLHFNRYGEHNFNDHARHALLLLISSSLFY
jgi:hypothetical protein